MKPDIRICPQCKVEYYSHIEKCVDCEIDLINPGEIINEQSELKLEDATQIGKGPITTLSLLIALLEDEKIPHRVELEERELHTDLTPSSEFGVYVHKDDTNVVVKLVQSLAHDEFPELKEAESSLDAGKCPACGAETGGVKICPECELPLWFDEE